MAAGATSACRSLIFMGPILAFNFLRTLGNSPDLRSGIGGNGEGGGGLVLLGRSMRVIVALYDQRRRRSSSSSASLLLSELPYTWKTPAPAEAHALCMASIREQTRRRARPCCPGDVVCLVYAAARSSGFGLLPNPAVTKASSDPDILKFIF